MGNGLAGIAYYASNDSDPYITLKNPVSFHGHIDMKMCVCVCVCVCVSLCPES